ncbi:MAG: hypothetical protein ABEJ96_04195, partial [Thiohalorhabdaceae bacterium]
MRRVAPAIGRLAVLALLAASPAAAQQATDNPTGQGGAGTDASEVQPEQGRQNLEKAYKREFAFLEAQKKSLQERLAQFESRAEAERGDLESQVQALKAKAVRLKTRMENVRESLDQAEERLKSNQSSQEVLRATFTQAGATLEEFG